MIDDGMQWNRISVKFLKASFILKHQIPHEPQHPRGLSETYTFKTFGNFVQRLTTNTKILTQPNDHSKCDSSQPPITYTYINAVETPKRTVTSSHCCQLLLKQLNLPEYWALCELCWLLVSSLWKRQKRCKKQTMGFKSANILRVLMDA